MGSFYVSGKGGDERHQLLSSLQVVDYRNLSFEAAALPKGMGMANMKLPLITPNSTFFSLQLQSLQKHRLYLQTRPAVDALHARIPNTLILKPAVI